MIPEASPDLGIPLPAQGRGAGLCGNHRAKIGPWDYAGKMGSCHRASPLVSWQSEWAAEGD